MSEQNSAVIFSHAAAAKVHDLIVEEGNLALNLRVYITGGGCSGFQYGFTFDESIQPDDTIVEQVLAADDVDDGEDEGEGGSGGGTKHCVKLLIDAMSFQYLVGAEIDYKEDMSGAQFVIRNPNATTTCGCGSSFSV